MTPRISSACSAGLVLLFIAARRMRTLRSGYRAASVSRARSTSLLGEVVRGRGCGRWRRLWLDDRVIWWGTASALWSGDVGSTTGAL